MPSKKPSHNIGFLEHTPTKRPCTLQAMKEVNQCYRFSGSNGNKLIQIFLPLILVNVILSIAMMCLLRRLQKEVKMYFVLQQITGAVFLLLAFLPSIIEQLIVSKNSVLELLPSYGESRMTRFLIKFMEFCYFLQSFFRHHGQTFMMMQLFNYQAMICDPMNFAQYKKGTKLAKRMALSCLISVVFSAHALIELILANLFTLNGTFLTMQYYVALLSFLDFFIFKIVVTVGLIVVSKKIKKSLDESRRVRQADQLVGIGGPFLCICVVPFVNNIISLGAEVPELIMWGKKLSATNNLACSGMSDFSLNVYLPLTGSSMLLCSVLTTVSYWISFPNLRQSCFQNVNVQG